jgi:hypothetical protein
MTNQQHPIVPDPKLLQEWYDDKTSYHADMIRAAQWGADQELLACGNYLKQCAAWEEDDVIEFYNYRRPKPPSLKEQALALLDKAEDPSWDINDFSIVRKALEQLDD